MEKYGWQHLSAEKEAIMKTKILEWLQEIGFKAKKQPLSGQLGGEYRGDILIDIGEDQLVVEVKYRDKVHSLVHFLFLKIETWLSIDAKQAHQNLY